MTERQIKKHHLRTFTGSEFDMSADELLRVVKEMQAETPQEFRSTIRVVYEAYWSDDPAEIAFYYFAPETDEEMAERIARDGRRLQETAQHELAILARLRAKYGQ